MKISMWSGPRNLSTALMYSFAARGDFDVWDEPFYAAYLKATGIDHPMHEQIIAHHETDQNKVISRLLAPSARHLYAKQMTLHMLPAFPREWMLGQTNVFLIRHPTRVIASYAAKRENPTLDDLGFRQQAQLFDQVTDHLGHAPIVIDSDDIRADPAGALGALCAAIGLAFTPTMLTWPRGPKSFDGIWASHWYGAVHRSTGFAPPEGDLPELDTDAQKLCDAALPFFDQLSRLRLRPQPLPAPT